MNKSILLLAKKALKFLFLTFFCLGTLQAEKRYFSVGIEKYDFEKKLSNPINDAKAVAKLLDQYNFKGQSLENPNRSDFYYAFGDFVDTVNSDDEVFLYLSGHGTRIENKNYLLPTDIRFKQYANRGRYKSGSILIDELITDIALKKPKILIAVIDACRGDPFIPDHLKGGPDDQSIKVQKYVDGAIFVIYSASEGQAAYDKLFPDEAHDNSVFARVLLNRLTPNDTINYIADKVQDEVALLINNQQYALKQVPDYRDNILGDYCLVQCNNSRGTLTTTKLALARIGLFNGVINDDPTEEFWISFNNWRKRKGDTVEHGIVLEKHLAELINESVVASSTNLKRSEETLTQSKLEEINLSSLLENTELNDNALINLDYEKLLVWDIPSIKIGTNNLEVYAHNIRIDSAVKIESFNETTPSTTKVGRDGKNGAPGIRDGHKAHGENGSLGISGAPGKDGEDSGDVVITANNLIGDGQIDVKLTGEHGENGGNGGKGGDGGDGGDGHNASSSGFKCKREPGDGGNGGNGGTGGNGGNGGNGGDGGILTINTVMVDAVELTNATGGHGAIGGKEGIGGDGGKGGSKGSRKGFCQRSAKEGYPGISGEPGQGGVYGSNGKSGKLITTVGAIAEGAQ